MTDINVTFCRAMLKTLTREVKQRFPEINLRDASVLKMSGGGRYWLFEYGHEFSAEVQADNAYDARYEGWKKFMQSRKVEGHC